MTKKKKAFSQLTTQERGKKKNENPLLLRSGEANINIQYFAD